MNCPYCGNEKTFTRGSRERVHTFKGTEIHIKRRQRQCPKCQRWHATVEVRESDSLTWVPEFGIQSILDEVHL